LRRIRAGQGPGPDDSGACRRPRRHDRYVAVTSIHGRRIEGPG